MVIIQMKIPIASLTNRELEVFELIGRGLTMKQIARKARYQPEDSRSASRWH